MRMKKSYMLLILLPVLALNGCGEDSKKKETFHTVSYYDKHADIRDARIKECKSADEMTKTDLIDCDNATQSYNKTQSPRFSPTDF